MLRSRRLRILLAAGGVLATVASLFLVSTAAQQTQQDLPKPDETALAQLTAIIDHYGGSTPEPPFSGVLNGFTFQGPPYPDFQDCEQDGPGGSTPALYGFGTDHGSARLAGSGLDFNPTYIAPGFRPVEAGTGSESGPVAAGQCGDQIVLVVQTWVSSTAKLSIERRALPPVLPNNRYSKDRLEATSINGRAAIIIKPRFAGELIEIFLRDEHSFWTVWGEGVSLDEVRRVAEGIR